MFHVAFGKCRAEGDVAALVHGAKVFEFAESAFEFWVQMRNGLRVVPDVRAGAVAAASVREAPLPSPKIAVFEAKHRWRFQDREIGGDSIEDVRRKGRGEKRLVKRESASAECRVVLFEVSRDFASVGPHTGVERPPRWRGIVGEGAAFVGTL